MTAWRKSSFCNGAATCVEVALIADLVAVRDSKEADGPVLPVPQADWRAFLDAVKTGTLGWVGGLVQFRRVAPDDWCMWLTCDTETELRFNEGEVRDFVKGVHAKEFDLETLGADGSSAARPQKAATAAVGVKFE